MSTGSPRFLYNAAVMLGVSLVQRMVGLALITVFSRVLDPKGLGAFTFVQSTSNTFSGMSRLGVDAGLHVTLAGLQLPEHKARAEAVLGEALALTLLLAAGTAVGMAVLAYPIADGLFGAPELRPFVLLSAALVLSNMLAQFCYVAFAGLQGFRRYSWISALGSLISATMGAVGALWQGAWGGAVGFATGQAFSVVLLAFGLFGETRARGLSIRLGRPGREAWTLLTIGFPFYLSVLLLLPIEFLGLSLLSRSAGLEALGELRVTQALIAVASLIPAALAGPTVSHLAAPDAGAGTPDRVLAQLKFYWMLALLIATGLFAIWPMAIDQIFGSAYPTATSYGVIAVAAFVPIMVVSVMTSALLALKRSSVLLLAGGIQALALGIACFLLIPRFGLAGLLLAQTVGFVAATVPLGLALVGQYGGALFRHWMLVLAVLTGAFFAVLALSIQQPWPQGIRAAAGTASGFTMLAMFYYLFSRPEREQLTSILLNAFKLARVNGRLRF